MKNIIRGQEERLEKLLAQKKVLEDEFVRTRTSNSKRSILEMRLTALLHQIALLRKSIKSQTIMTSAVETRFEQLQTAKNKHNQLLAARNVTRKQAAPKTGLLQRLLGTAPSTSTTTTTTSSTASPYVSRQPNIFSPEQRKELNEFEAEIMASQGWKNMMAKNAMKEKLKLNIRAAKNKKQKNYYEKMLKALENSANQNTTFTNMNTILSTLEGDKPLTAEEEAELQAVFNGLEEDRTGAGAPTKPSWQKGLKEPTAENIQEVENFLAENTPSSFARRLAQTKQPTAENIKEVENYLAGHEGGKSRKTRRRRLTRRR